MTDFGKSLYGFFIETFLKKSIQQIWRVYFLSNGNPY